MNASSRSGHPSLCQPRRVSCRAARPTAPRFLSDIPFALFLLGLIAGQSVQAQVIYTDIADIIFSNSTGEVQIDMGTGGATGSAVFGPGPNTWDFRVNGTSGLGKLFIEGNTGHLADAHTDLDTPLAQGSVIGPGSVWLSGDNATFAQTAAANLFGVRFDGGDGTNYGWIRIIDNVDGSFTLTDFAYRVGGGDIGAGATAIPEPSTTAAVAGLLAASAALWHRRQKKLAA